MCVYKRGHMETTDYADILALLPATSIVAELAQEIERARLEAGLTTEEMLEDLRRQRQQYYEEHYGPERSSHDKNAPGMG